MKFSHTLALSASSAIMVAAVDISPYIAGNDVEDGFKAFVEEYYLISEDKAATTTFTDMWTSDAVMVLQGSEFDGADAMLRVRNSLLPSTGTPSKDWWHLIEGAQVVGEDASTKTYAATIVIQTTYVPGNCSQAHGIADFTVLKDVSGLPILTPHDQNLKIYNLTVNTALSPTNEACTASERRP